MTINQLKTRAKAYGMIIGKDGKGGYRLIDISTNSLAASEPMSIEQIEEWFEDLDMQEK